LRHNPVLLQWVLFEQRKHHPQVRYTKNGSKIALFFIKAVTILFKTWIGGTNQALGLFGAGFGVGFLCVK